MTSSAPIKRRVNLLDLTAKTRISSITAALAMEHLANHGTTCMAEIAKAVNSSTANLTGIVDNLYKEKLVDRVTAPADRRKLLITLTMLGRGYLE
jgi:DNA-binding MarR family transcriptional regulator